VIGPVLGGSAPEAAAVEAAAAGSAAPSPGLLDSHYAPHTPL
jgi:hypothetical protein